MIHTQLNCPSSSSLTTMSRKICVMDQLHQMDFPLVQGLVIDAVFLLGAVL